MTDSITAEITCGACGTDLHLRYTLAARDVAASHPLGCPECQATADVLAAVERLRQDAAPMVLDISALEKKTEIGVGASTAPHAGEAAVAP